MKPLRLSFPHPAAPRAYLLRGGLVGGHLAVLAGLALALGLADFGSLIVLWGLALVAAAVLGCGGPLVLLARLGVRGPVSLAAVLALCLGWPLAVAVLLWPVAVALADLPWLGVLALGLMVHLVTCLASVMRALGSVHLSMALRDGAPIAALGLAGIGAPPAAQILWQAGGALAVVAVIAAIWCLRHPRRAGLIGRKGALIGPDPALWAVAVLGMLIAQMDIVLGGAVMPPEAIGLYALVRRFANLAALPLSVATWVSTGPITAAHAAGSASALQAAADAGGRIALWPGLALAALALAAAAASVPPAALPVLAVLLAAGVVQLVFGMGMSVATLTGRGLQAAAARLAGLGSYAALILVLAPLDPLRNALAAAAATLLSSGLLWLWLQRAPGVNTAFLPIGRRIWTMS